MNDTKITYNVVIMASTQSLTHFRKSLQRSEMVTAETSPRSQIHALLHWNRFWGVTNFLKMTQLWNLSQSSLLSICWKSNARPIPTVPEAVTGLWIPRICDSSSLRLRALSLTIPTDLNEIRKITQSVLTGARSSRSAPLSTPIVKVCLCGSLCTHMHVGLRDGRDLV